MAINLSDPKEMHEELLTHAGHDIECVSYARGRNVTIECMTCGVVLVDSFEPLD